MVGDFLGKSTVNRSIGVLGYELVVIIMCTICSSKNGGTCGCTKFPCRWCRLIVVCTILTTGINILARLRSLIVENDSVFHFDHDMVGAQSSAHPPGQKGSLVNFRSWYVIRRLIVVWSSRLQ